MKKKFFIVLAVLLFFCGSIYAASSTKLSATGTAYTGKCLFHGFILGTDGSNDPTITIYDGTDNSGGEVVPTADQPADQKGWYGLIHYNCLCRDGIYVEITCSGTVEVVVLWRHAGGKL